MENTELITKDKFEISQMPEHASEQLNGIELVYPQLKIPAGGNTFWEVDEEPVKELLGVIVYHKPVHVYFESEYDGSAIPPKCSSIDGISGKWMLDIDPNFFNEDTEKAEKTDNTTTDDFEIHDCATCPYNVFGSAKNGGKACKEKHQLYILTSGGLVPYSLLLPVSSVGVLNAYATKLYSKGRFLNGVITAFTLEKATNKTNIVYSKLVLKAVRDLTSEESEAIAKITESVKANG
jgi:hypothetical protein